jgi:flagellar hook-associated protein FlgK
MAISGIATSALLAAQKSTHIRAHNIVNVQTPDFTPRSPALVSEGPTGGVAVFAQEANGPVNLARETIGLIQASAQYEAAAALIKTDQDLNEVLLNAVG